MSRSNPEDVVELPVPDAEAQAHSAALRSLIETEIEHAGGRIPFQRYMELALYAPGLGYYAAGAAKFARDGDFVTAPEISSLFSRCVARQAEQVLASVPGGEVFEVGAGRGRMALDVLNELERRGCAPVRYSILETSPTLRRTQRQTLGEWASDGRGVVEWVDALPRRGFEGLVVANELLDALPVARFILGDAPLEVFVGLDGDSFRCLSDTPATAGLEPAVDELLQRLGSELPRGYCSEMGLLAQQWLSTLMQRLERGLVLLFDYGYPEAEYYHPQRGRGTLSCYHRHRRHDDPFWWPGLQDITAHVDFSAVAKAAIGSGGEVSGFTTQANFLLSCGVLDLLAGAEPGSADYLQLAGELKQLTLPGEMGDAVKALGCTRNLSEPLLGFSHRDYADRLQPLT